MNFINFYKLLWIFYLPLLSAGSLTPIIFKISIPYIWTVCSCSTVPVYSYSLVYVSYVRDKEFPLPFNVFSAALRIIDMRQINSRKSNVVSYIKTFPCRHEIPKMDSMRLIWYPQLRRGIVDWTIKGRETIVRKMRGDVWKT